MIFLIKLAEETVNLIFLLQIKFQPNDHGEIRDLADEIKNFEGIRHESLVKYYGVELHRVSLHTIFV